MYRLGAGIYDKFTRALTDAVNKFKVGDGFSEGVVQVVTCAHPFTL